MRHSHPRSEWESSFVNFVETIEAHRRQAAAVVAVRPHAFRFSARLVRSMFRADLLVTRRAPFSRLPRGALVLSQRMKRLYSLLRRAHSSSTLFLISLQQPLNHSLACGVDSKNSLRREPEGTFSFCYRDTSLYSVARIYECRDQHWGQVSFNRTPTPMQLRQISTQLLEITRNG